MRLLGRLVMVVDGPFRGLRGIVDHQYGDALFLQLTEKAYEHAFQAEKAWVKAGNECDDVTWAYVDVKGHGVRVMRNNVEVIA